ncbi:MAG: restriction endonuclease subunit S [Carboxylicivirga sp.]|jgi:type I restriction enzyme S subunit|nr:restriction endonuclease subunit S [Carboxylicivirga sp.]
MVSDWKEYRLGDITDWYSGGTPPKKNDKYWNGEIAWISASSMYGNRFSDSELKLTELGLKKGSRLACKGSILLLVRGSSLHQRIPVGIAMEDVAFNQDVKAIVPKEEYVDSWYLLYWFLSEEKNLLQKVETTGIGAGKFDTKVLQDLIIRVPPKTIRNNISKTFRVLDDKIANNNRINQTLEQIAQAFFKSWFIDFDPVKAKIEAKEQGKDPQLAAMMVISGKTLNEILQLPQEKQNELVQTAKLFPDQLVESELGKIPEGWILKPLYETAEYVNGGAFKSKDFTESKEGLPIIKIAELKSGISAQTKYTTKDIPEKYRINNDDMLYSWSGSPETSLEVFKWYGGQGWLNQHIFKINTENIEQKVFVYYLLKLLKPQLIQIAKNKQTTGLGHVTVADMKRMQVVMPNENSYRLITDNFIALFKQASNCMKQNLVLSLQRDTLLPKLLSGEITTNL